MLLPPRWNHARRSSSPWRTTNCWPNTRVWCWKFKSRSTSCSAMDRESSSRSKKTAPSTLTTMPSRTLRVAMCARSTESLSNLLFLLSIFCWMVEKLSSFFACFIATTWESLTIPSLARWHRPMRNVARKRWPFICASCRKYSPCGASRKRRRMILSIAFGWPWPCRGSSLCRITLRHKRYEFFIEFFLLFLCRAEWTLYGIRMLWWQLSFFSLEMGTSSCPGMTLNGELAFVVLGLFEKFNFFAPPILIRVLNSLMYEGRSQIIDTPLPARKRKIHSSNWSLVILSSSLWGSNLFWNRLNQDRKKGKKSTFERSLNVALTPRSSSLRVKTAIHCVFSLNFEDRRE